MLTFKKLRTYTTLEMHTHMVPACTHSWVCHFPYPEIISDPQPLFTSLLPAACTIFLSIPHPHLCYESSDLPASPSPAWITSYLLTNFCLSPSLFSCLNCLSDEITLFLSTGFPSSVWSRHCEILFLSFLLFLDVTSSPISHAHLCSANSPGSMQHSLALFGPNAVCPFCFVTLWYKTHASTQVTSSDSAHLGWQCHPPHLYLLPLSAPYTFFALARYLRHLCKGAETFCCLILFIKSVFFMIWTESK